MKNQKKNIIFLLLLIFTPLIPSRSVPESYPQTGEVIPVFDFTLTNNTIVNINDYSGKPIVLEWSASWCGTCSSNHLRMKYLYADYGDKVNFLSISYYDSGDTLSRVNDMKGSYKWDFGLDHLDYGSSVLVSNAHTWILDENLTMVAAWKLAVISRPTVRGYLDSLLGVENTSSETNPSILGLDLLTSNPLFLGFSLLVVVGIGYLIIVRIRK